MNWRNTDNNFGLTSKLFHWLLAGLIFGLLVFGMYLDNTKIGIADLYLYGWHKALGLLAFSLIILRVLWAQLSIKPAVLGPGNWQSKTAVLIHKSLYAMMLVMPLSGWIASSASGFPMSFFGLFPLPAIAPESERIEYIFFLVHGIAAKAMIVALILHISGAFQRHFIKRDNTLRRMWF